MKNPASSGMREVLRLALPIILSMASTTIMSFVNTWMVAMVGTAEVAAAMPAGIVIFTIESLAGGMVRCVGIFAAQALGRGAPREGSAYAWQGIYLSLAAGVFCFILWPWAPAFFSSFGHEPEVASLEVIYFRVRLWSLGPSVMIAALGAFFYGIHRPMILLVTTVVADVINVILAYALIFGKLGAPALGLRGAGLAIVFASALQALFLLAAFLSNPFHQAFATRSTLRPSYQRLRQLFHIGWPAGVQAALDILGWGLLIILLVGRFGKEHLAASNIAIQYMTISFMPALGLSLAATALVGKYIGAGRLELATRRTYETLFLAVGYMVSMGVIFFMFRNPLMSFFSADPTVVAAGGPILICAALFQTFDAMGLTFIGALRGAGDTHWIAGATVALLLMAFAPLSLGAVAFTDLKSLGPWLGGTAYVILLGLVMWWRFTGRRWQEINIFTTAAHGGS